MGQCGISKALDPLNMMLPTSCLTVRSEFFRLASFALFLLNIQSCPATVEDNFSRLFPGSCSFSHDSILMNVGEGWNMHGPVNLELHFVVHLLLHHQRLEKAPHYSRYILLIHPTMIKTPRSCSGGRNLLLIQ
ncbi:hypothetical protein ILYODFUR_029107 [Ilyodon furcidens]|uniref:Uncharacterized protein n=1 Tax=Ilyodon furcidens TaxID=33524 RepID=A0ABV0VI68_9TELE